MGEQRLDYEADLARTCMLKPLHGLTICYANLLRDADSMWISLCHGGFLCDDENVSDAKLSQRLGHLVHHPRR